MKIPVIKSLVESYSKEQLVQAEEALMDEGTPPIEVLGDDEGEQLTHVLAAIFIHEQMVGGGMDFSTALREYTKKVRASIC
ncbi:MAG: hypothetical protein K2Q22_16055 [Cytophagales bacterium]|nr:hypothetical protein [Cytophagales bacterium]